jgi:hypothetical protein
MPTSIFVSYRRDDTGGHAGRLADRLVARFGKARVFRDIDAIAAGANFVEVIHRAVGECDVLLALIGRQWLTLADAQGRRRLDAEDDFVRLEIAAALQRQVRVIPVLVQGASMPEAPMLPDALKGLARCQALGLTEQGWEDDVARLLKAIRSRPPWPRYVLAAAAAALLIVAVKLAPLARRPDDVKITREVQAALSNDARLGRFPIEVETTRGTVRLAGTVPTERDVDRAEDVARGVPGVRKVAGGLKASQ